MTRYLALFWNARSRVYEPMRELFTVRQSAQKDIRKDFPNVIFQPLTPDWECA